MYIEGIVLEHFSGLPKIEINASTKSYPRHAVFHSLLSDYSKQDSAITTLHRKRLIALLKRKKILTSSLSTIRENTDGCVEHYRCDSALYLMAVMSQFYSVIIDGGISAPGHEKEVVYGLNAIDKRYIYQLMSNVQLLGSKIFDSQIIMHSCTQKIMLVWINN